MLVAISDLHLTDCSTSTNPHSTAIELLMKELEANLEAKEAKEIRFLLLGDIFDLVRTDYWHREAIPAGKRPWGGTLDRATGMNTDPDVERQFQEVLAGVLRSQSSVALIDGIKKMAQGDLPTSVHYVRGNHDRVLNNFPSLEQQIVAAFHPVPVEFSNELHAPDYAVFARHGHQWDEQCHGWHFLTKVLDKRSKAKRFDPETYRVMAIGEVVTAELMSGFVFHVTEKLGPGNTFRDLCAEVNNVRPMQHAVAWLTWLLRDLDQNGEFDTNIEAAKDAFRKALDGILDCSLAKEWDSVKRDWIFSGDLTDYLSKARAILNNRQRGLDWLQTLIRLFEGLQNALTAVTGHREDEYYKGAAGELGGKDLPAGVQYLLYGHTHSARQNCITAERNGSVKMYVNTGTFLPLIEHADDGKSYFRSNRMTFICFYRKDEDTSRRKGDGPTMDVWDGMKRKDYL
ncbi:MAG TPA: hypothetical protein VJT67_13435 [Longimicrobiaceae bacterium]|nr:hypothetical protein [Longimicrobiaceae bacterium]